MNSKELDYLVLVCRVGTKLCRMVGTPGAGSIILSTSMCGNSHIPNSSEGFYKDPLVGAVIWELQY